MIQLVSSDNATSYEDDDVYELQLGTKSYELTYALGWKAFCDRVGKARNQFIWYNVEGMGRDQSLRNKADYSVFRTAVHDSNGPVRAKFDTYEQSAF